MKKIIFYLSIFLFIIIAHNTSYADGQCPIKIEHEIGKHVQGFNAISLIDDPISISKINAYIGEKEIRGISVPNRKTEIDKKGNKVLIFVTSEKDKKITKIIVDIKNYGKCEFNF